MQIFTVTAEHLRDGIYVGDVDVTDFDGHLEIAADLGWVKFGANLKASGGIRALPGTGIMAGGGIEAGGDIEAGTYIKAGGDIMMTR